MALSPSDINDLGHGQRPSFDIESSSIEIMAISPLLTGAWRSRQRRSYVLSSSDSKNPVCKRNEQITSVVRTIPRVRF